jgi:hypothetical protein
MHRDRTDGHLICYDIPKLLQDSAPQPIKDILAARKYLGVPSNGQLDGTEGKEKILKKLNQRIGLISTKADSINEAKIAHNMMVCQVATFSPICINFSLRKCATQRTKPFLSARSFFPVCSLFLTNLTGRRSRRGLETLILIINRIRNVHIIHLL